MINSKCLNRLFIQCLGYNVGILPLLLSHWHCADKELKGHCHGYFLAFLVKWRQNYDLVVSTMQEMLLERKGKDI